MKILSPVFFKEFGQAAVSRRFFWLELTILCVLLLDFGVVFLNSPHADSAMLSRMPSIGKSLFWSMAWIQAAALLVFVPAVTAGVVCGEREANTLGLLFLTRLRPWQIVQDKGLSRVASMVFLCLVTLPFMIAALLFGGVEMREVVMVAAVLLSIILLAAGFAMLCSALFAKYVTALAAAYTALGLYLLLSFIAFGLLDEAKYISFEYSALVNPILTMAVLADESVLRRHPNLSLAWAWNILFSMAAYVFAILSASLLLRRGAGLEGAPANAPARRTWRLGIVRLAASCLQRGAAVGARPVLWKESNLVHDQMRSVLINIVEVVFVVWLAVTALLSGFYWDILSDNEFYLVSHALGAFGTLLILGIFAASAFTRERESGTLDILLSTRLKGADIVFQTFLGLVRAALPMLLPVLLILIAGYLFTSCEPVVAFLFGKTPRQSNSIVPWFAVLNLLVFTAFVLAAGLCISLRQKTTALAVGWTMALLLFLGVGLPFAGVILEEFLGLRNSFESVMVASPVYWIAEGPGSRRYTQCGGTNGYAACLAAYSAISVIMLYFAAREFDRRMGRQP